MSSLAARLSATRYAGRERIVPVLAIASKRFANNRLMVLAALFGLVVAVALVTAIPLYANGVATQALRRELGASASESVMPRASILLAYVPGRNSAATSLDVLGNVDSFVKDRASRLPGLSPLLSMKYAQTNSFSLFVQGEARSGEARGDIFFASMGGFADHVQVLEGRLPRAGDELEALISTEGLDELGLRVGEVVDIAIPQSGGQGSVPVRIVGRWYPENAQEPYWFNQVKYFKNALFVPEDALFRSVLSSSARSLREYGWYFVYDPSHIDVADIDALLPAFSQLRSGAQQVLRGLKVDASPEDLLERYRQKAFFLQVLLFVLGAPILAIVLQFVAVVATMLIERQKDEITTLKSRGATMLHILSMFIVEWSLLGLVAVVVGTLLGTALAGLLGFCNGFLIFLGTEGLLQVRLMPEILLYAIAAVSLSIVAALIPAAEAARHSIVTHKQEVSRSLRQGVLTRYFVDLLPVPVAAYSYYMLLQRQSVLPVGEAGDAFSDPQLLLGPAIFVFAGSFVFLRVFPILIALVERLVNPFVGVSPLVALRQISREPQQHRALLLLLTLTTALGGFSASVAATLDENNRDIAHYRVGSDVRLGETGTYDDDTEEWTLVPLDEHLNTSGVESAARVFRTMATEKIGTRGGDVTVLGIDPAEFGNAVYWRNDYSSLPLPQLLGALAADETGALVDRRLLDAYHLDVGDQISLNFKQQTVDFTIVGALGYFPTLYPDSGRFMVANVDYLFANIGAQPYDVWVRLKPGANATAVVDDLRGRDVPVVRFEELGQAVAERQKDPTRLGALGTLSIGFLIAALLSVLTLLLYSFLSFRKRMQQLGILRAIGLSLGQLTGIFLTVHGLVVLFGVGAGTALAYLSSSLFIPFLQIRAEQHAGIPPFMVVTAWADVAKLYLVLAIFLALALSISLWLLRRIRIYEAIRFGEERG